MLILCVDNTSWYLSKTGNTIETEEAATCLIDARYSWMCDDIIFSCVLCSLFHESPIHYHTVHSEHCKQLQGEKRNIHFVSHRKQIMVLRIGCNQNESQLPNVQLSHFGNETQEKTHFFLHGDACNFNN